MPDFFFPLKNVRLFFFSLKSIQEKKPTPNLFSKSEFLKTFIFGLIKRKMLFFFQTKIVMVLCVPG